jgi:hypothetical protein
MHLTVLVLIAVLATDVADLQTRGNIWPYLIVFVFGFMVGIAGHLVQSTDLVIAGILIAGVAATLPWLVWA